MFPTTDAQAAAAGFRYAVARPGGPALVYATTKSEAVQAARDHHGAEAFELVRSNPSLSDEDLATLKHAVSRLVEAQRGHEREEDSTGVANSDIGLGDSLTEAWAQIVQNDEDLAGVGWFLAPYWRQTTSDEKQAAKAARALGIVEGDETDKEVARAGSKQVREKAQKWRDTIRAEKKEQERQEKSELKNAVKVKWSGQTAKLYFPYDPALSGKLRAIFGSSNVSNGRDASNDFFWQVRGGTEAQWKEFERTADATSGRQVRPVEGAPSFPEAGEQVVSGSVVEVQWTGPQARLFFPYAPEVLNVLRGVFARNLDKEADPRTYKFKNWLVIKSNEAQWKQFAEGIKPLGWVLQHKGQPGWEEGGDEVPALASNEIQVTWTGDLAKFEFQFDPMVNNLLKQAFGARLESSRGKQPGEFWWMVRGAPEANWNRFESDVASQLQKIVRHMNEPGFASAGEAKYDGLLRVVWVGEEARCHVPYTKQKDIGKVLRKHFGDRGRGRKIDSARDESGNFYWSVYGGTSVQWKNLELVAQNRANLKLVVEGTPKYEDIGTTSTDEQKQASALAVLPPTTRMTWTGRHYLIEAPHSSQVIHVLGYGDEGFQIAWHEDDCPAVWNGKKSTYEIVTWEEVTEGKGDQAKKVMKENRRECIACRERIQKGIWYTAEPGRAANLLAYADEPARMQLAKEQAVLDKEYQDMLSARQHSWDNFLTSKARKPLPGSRKVPKPDCWNNPRTKECDKLAYLPYQEAGANYILGKDAVLLADSMGLGKAQPLDAKILTPTGWRTMGDIKVGDHVIGSAGSPVEVTGVYPQGEKDIYEIRLVVDRKTQCCEDHLWRFEYESEWKVESLRDLIEKHKTSLHKCRIPVLQSAEVESRFGIREIVFVGKKRAQCIMVDAPDHLYVTDDFILTHNTVQALATINMMPQADRILILGPVVSLLNWKEEAEKWLLRSNPVSTPSARDRFRIAVLVDNWDMSDIDTANVVICNYDKLVTNRDLFERLMMQDWDLLVADESHYCKLRTGTDRHTVSKRTLRLFGWPAEDTEPALQGLVHRAKKRLFMTGTPIPNRPIELWPLLNHLIPGRFRDRWAYGKAFCDVHKFIQLASEKTPVPDNYKPPKGKEGKASQKVQIEWRGAGRRDTDGNVVLARTLAMHQLQAVLRSNCMVRRLASEVLDLPPKTRISVMLKKDAAIEAALAQEQEWLDKFGEQDLVKELPTASEDFKSRWSDLKDRAEEIMTELENLEPGSPEWERKEKDRVGLMSEAGIPFNAISKTFRIMGEAKTGSAWAYVEGLLENPEIGKLVVFAYHTNVLDRLERYARAKLESRYGSNCLVRIDGKVSSAKVRQERKQIFQEDPNCQIFLGQVQAVSTAITLTAAHHVVFVQQDWVPGTMSQAECRVWRIGQKSPVTVHMLLVDGSIDANMSKKLLDKMDLQASALDRAPSAASVGDALDWLDAGRPCLPGQCTEDIAFSKPDARLGSDEEIQRAFETRKGQVSEFVEDEPDELVDWERPMVLPEDVIPRPALHPVVVADDDDEDDETRIEREEREEEERRRTESVLRVSKLTGVRVPKVPEPEVVVPKTAPVLPPVVVVPEVRVAEPPAPVTEMLPEQRRERILRALRLLVDQGRPVSPLARALSKLPVLNTDKQADVALAEVSRFNETLPEGLRVQRNPRRRVNLRRSL